ncbi:MBL fold metallo-hydrolase [Paenalcaligenes sp. Me131]|uniref:MBL fold metallo-hydrolase n=1 Tax=Paenalcaligenes sp. Me131 TaxID=3392636 RepID=UPI003D287374
MTTWRYAFSTAALAVAAVLAGAATTAVATEPTAASAVAVNPAQHTTLTIEPFNWGDEAIFAVSSVLVQGKEEAILIDAQFSATEAKQLVEKITATGKRLSTIYISHGDPDYYFGLATLHAAFPDAHIVATPATIAHIEATKDAKLAFWGPKMGDGAPSQLIVPQPLEGDTLLLEGQELNVVGLDGPTPDRTVVWIPSIKTVVGGIPVMSGEHVWMADTRTPQSHADWLATLEHIKALAPEVVIPGHYLGELPTGVEAVTFTADYIQAFDEEAAKASNSPELIAAMKERYPALLGDDSLVLSAAVAKGEMQWP